MKLCIVSDTHLLQHELHAAALLSPDVDLFLHAGDETVDAIWLAKQVDVPVQGVAGNCDVPTSTYPIERVVDAGVRTYLTHGHRLGVNSSLDALAARAREIGATIAVYGHTHIAMVKEVDGVLLINPGSLSASRGGFKVCTYAVLTVDVQAGKAVCKVDHQTTDGRTLSSFVTSITK